MLVSTDRHFWNYVHAYLFENLFILLQPPSEVHGQHPKQSDTTSNDGEGKGKYNFHTTISLKGDLKDMCKYHNNNVLKLGLYTPGLSQTYLKFERWQYRSQCAKTLETTQQWNAPFFERMARA